jgi:hypothetical protein
MKRTLILAVGFLAVTAIAASAQTPTTPQPAARTAIGANFVDTNGDGICDLYQSGTRQGQGQGQGKGKGYGRGNGTGSHVGPQDGSGYGAPAGAGTGAGTGICDGTGPKGKGRGPRR